MAAMDLTKPKTNATQPQPIPFTSVYLAPATQYAYQPQPLPTLAQPVTIYPHYPPQFPQLHYATTPQTSRPPLYNPLISPVSPQSASLPSNASSPSVSPVSVPGIKRPFKSLCASKMSSFNLVSAIDPSIDAEYAEYRQNVLSRVHPTETKTNRNMKRNMPVNPEKVNDPEYIERRKKNNEAARKSREARKAKEDELAIKVAFLEKENLRLKFQLAAIEREKKMILSRHAGAGS